MILWGRKKEKKVENHVEKSSTDIQEVWLKGFETGFRCAWDWMVPYMQEARDEVKKKAYEQAMDKALQDLEPTVRRMESLGYQIR